jgi:5-methylcytosine-specific restriction endonuclease McrA
MRKPYIVTCQGCGKSFPAVSRNIKYHVKCNPRPARKPGREHLSTDLLHTIMARDKLTCQECGIRNIDDFEVHHINGNWKDNRTDNLVLLCRKCHAKARSNGLPKYKVKKVKILKEPPCKKRKKKQLFKNIN